MGVVSRPGFDGGWFVSVLRLATDWRVGKRGACGLPHGWPRYRGGGLVTARHSKLRSGRDVHIAKPMTRALALAVCVTAMTLGVAGCGGNWTKVQAAGDVPPARAGHCMVYDSRNDIVILFGGNLLDGSGSEQNDTWGYDPATQTWAELRPAGDLPPARTDASMAYDSGRGLCMLFGGDDWPNGEEVCFNDLWAYDAALNTWTELDPPGEVPSGRRGQAMVYDSASDQLILFGGALQGGVLQNDTWAYDLVANTWTKVDPAGEVPTAREAHVMAYDPGAAKVVLFGGYGAQRARDPSLNDTWAYAAETSTWTELVPCGRVPSPRRWASLVYDARAGQVLLAGGENLGDDLGDLWTLDSAANLWADTGAKGRLPSWHSGHAMVYDSRRDQLILFGGASDHGPANDTWVLQLEPQT
jgi:N-acetylneuraminic acid mutarotase